ncbi:helix-turn-helix domain-containing protein [Leifsonia sp. 2TAF2]|uniref:helix-turn-helix domain-containing protein n=1 Tax=Leifsonia sp. 2TAF2 TaxID=3233009 RepID=UPI003F99BEBA
MLLRHAIGSVLRRIRTERGTTLRELSESSRVSVPYLSEIERGRKEASSEILAALCRVLDLSEGELLTHVAAEFDGAQVLSLVPGPNDRRDERTAAELQPAVGSTSSGVVAIAA